MQALTFSGGASGCRKYIARLLRRFGPPLPQFVQHPRESWSVTENVNLQVVPTDAAGSSCCKSIC